MILASYWSALSASRQLSHNQFCRPVNDIPRFLVPAIATSTFTETGKGQSQGRGRARRWMTRPVPDFTATLLLPGPLPSGNPAPHYGASLVLIVFKAWKFLLVIYARKTTSSTAFCCINITMLAFF
jgi:hypothetical protein